MKRIIYSILFVSCVQLTSCSKQALEGNKPTTEEKNFEIIKGARLLENSKESFLKMKVPDAEFSESKIAKLSVTIKDSYGNIVNNGVRIKPSSTYTIHISKESVCNVILRAGKGFDIVSTIEDDNSSQIIIRTEAEVPDQIYVSLVPYKKKQGASTLVKSAPQNFLLPKF